MLNEKSYLYKQNREVFGVYKKNWVESMRKVASNFGLTVVTIANEGQEYSTRPKNDGSSWTGPVPEGSEYVSVSGAGDPKTGYSEFWKAVREEIKRREEGANQQPR